jgi:hypothetical protein
MNSMCTWLEAVAATAVAVLALLTFIKGIGEYKKQGSQKRADFFIIMRNRLKENQSFKNICNLLNQEKADFTNISEGDKIDFLGFFEEVALMVNSNLIKKGVAHHMFGYYAINCWKSNTFWEGKDALERESIYWRVFKEFAIEMENVESKKAKRTYKFKKSDYCF